MGQGALLFRASLGDVLRAERMRQGMTLRDLSSSARVSLGYISEIERGQKEASSELLAALLRVAEGDTVFTPGLAGLVLGEYRRLSDTGPADAKDDTPRLTERETEVLRLVAKGMSYKQIAERLFLSHRTVQNHVQNTLRKLQLHNRVQLVRYAIEQGLDDEE